jgi:hypothetical protein
VPEVLLKLGLMASQSLLRNDVRITGEERFCKFIVCIADRGGWLQSWRAMFAWGLLTAHIHYEMEHPVLSMGWRLSFELVDRNPWFGGDIPVFLHQRGGDRRITPAASSINASIAPTAQKVK